MNRNQLSKVFGGALLFLIAGQGHAFSPGDTQVLSQILASMKEQVQTLKKELEEVKATNEEIFKAREYLGAVREEYEFVTRFDPDREIQGLTAWADGFTNLDDLSDARNWRSRWNLISGEIDKRFKDSDLPPESEEKARRDAYENASELVRLQILQEEYESQALNTEGKSSKDYQRQTASSSALMTSMMLEEKEARLREKIERQKSTMRKLEWDQQFLQLLDQ